MHTIPNQRSPRGKLKQAIRKFIFSTSFQDHILAETVCRVNREELLGYASTFSMEVTVSDIPNVEKGEVLLDNRARGTFQKIGVPPK